MDKSREDKIFKLLKDTGNEHILTFLKEISTNNREKLLTDIEQINFIEINKYFAQFNKAKSLPHTYTPAKFLSISERKELFFSKGNDALKNGKVGFLTVAGGQASRLGIDIPKGCYGISPVKNKSLFQIFSEKIKFYSSHYKRDFKWFIMTSESNYSDTVSFFEKNNYFNLEKNQVYFFKQSFFPTLTTEGKLILEDKDKLFVNPDGHGGVINALIKNGLDKVLHINKIDYLSYFQVDNPLVNLADPYFIGYHIDSESNITTKVIKKLYPEEKLGLIINEGDKNKIIEYSDMPKEDMEAKNTDGKLKYEIGSIGIHILSVNFFIKESANMPLHFAKKEISAFDFSDTNNPQIKKIDAVKFEKFIFDLITLTKKSVFFEADRLDEFAPLKNKEGTDSIETTIKGQTDQYKLWLSEARIMRNNESDMVKIEISPLFAPDKYIFIQKAEKFADKLKEVCYITGGKLNNEIYIC